MGDNELFQLQFAVCACTVVFLEEQKCHLKHLFRYVEGQGHTCRS